MEMTKEILQQLSKIHLPDPNSHKGQNGRLLVIGGSELFHSSIFWSADVASKIVDMVHFSSPANENNKIVRQKLKNNFWSGIVVDWASIDTYIAEDDAVVIGPGMERTEQTAEIVNSLLTKYPEKKWVIDGGALQMVDPTLFMQYHILTPHHQELELLYEKTGATDHAVARETLLRSGATILAKGPTDHIWRGRVEVPVSGGTAGMTKGGTGDVLAGLVGALYCQHDALVAAVVGSVVNKAAAEQLWQSVGPYFAAGDLVQQVPKTLWEMTKSSLH